MLKILNNKVYRPLLLRNNGNKAPKQTTELSGSRDRLITAVHISADRH